MMWKSTIITIIQVVVVRTIMTGNIQSIVIQRTFYKFHEVHVPNIFTISDSVI